MRVLIPFVLSIAMSSALTSTGFGQSTQVANIRIGGDSLIKAVATNSDGTRVVFIDQDGRIFVHDVAIDKAVYQKLDGKVPLNAVAMSGDGGRIAVAGPAKVTYSQFPIRGLTTPFASVESGLRTNGSGTASEEELKASAFAVFQLPMVGPLKFTAVDGGSVRIYDVAKGGGAEEHNDLEYPVVSLHFVKNGNIIIIDKVLRIIEIEDKKILPIAAFRHSVSSGSYTHPQTSPSSDGRRIAVSAATAGSKTIKIKLLDVNQDQLSILKSDRFPSLPWAVAISPDGRRFATAGPDGTVYLWDFDTQNQIGTFAHKLNKNITFLQFSRDGRRLFSAGRDGGFRLWDLGTGRALLSADEPLGDVRAVTISDGGVRVVTGGYRLGRAGVEPLLVRDFGATMAGDKN